MVLDLIRHGVGSAVCSIQPADPSFARRFAEAGAEVGSLGVRSRLDFVTASRARRLFRPGRFDLVQSHLFHANLLARFFCRDLPLVCAHHTVERRFLPWRAWAERWGSGFSRFEICPSRAALDSVARAGVPREKLKVVRNGVDVARFARAQRSEGLRRSLGVRGGELLLACVARLSRVKRHDILLHALSMCDWRGRLRLALVGDGPERRNLHVLARRLGIADGVTFTGSRADVPAVLASSDIFLFASMAEGFGLSVAEAMASGLPVVASAVDALKEFVSDGETGLFFPPGDARSLAETIEILVSDASRRRGLGLKAREYASRELDVRGMVEGYARVHEEALASA